jgi:hypothetical protein
MQEDTEAGRGELPAYCRGILNPAPRLLLFFANARPAVRKTHASHENPTESHLKSTKRRHLLSEMVLVLANSSVPSSNCLVFAHHDVLCDLVEQSVIGLVQG